MSHTSWFNDHHTVSSTRLLEISFLSKFGSEHPGIQLYLLGHIQLYCIYQRGSSGNKFDQYSLCWVCSAQTATTLCKALRCSTNWRPRRWHGDMVLQCTGSLCSVDSDSWACLARTCPRATRRWPCWPGKVGRLSYLDCGRSRPFRSWYAVILWWLELAV